MKRIVAPLLIALLASILQLELYRSNWGERIEYAALDLWYNVRGAIDAPSDVVVVGMDEASYRALDLSLTEAWPRHVHSDLLRKLYEAGAKRVVFDILFLGESSPGQDEPLAEALPLTPTVLGAEEAVKEHNTESGGYQLQELLTPPPLFTTKAWSLGLVGLPEDNGHVRRFLTEKGSVGKDLPTLSEAAAGLVAPDGERPGPRDLINFYGPPGSIKNYSYYQVIDRDKPLPAEFLKDKIVFVGLLLRTYIGPAQKDVFLTPFYQSARMFGTEIHATAAANLLQRNWIRRYSGFREGLFLIAATFAASLLIMLCRPQWGALLVFGGALTWSLSAYFMFLSHQFIPGAALFYLFLPLFLLFSTLYYYFVTRRAQLQMKFAFERYVSPEMAASISDKGVVSLGGEKIWATAMFTDIADFTSITEDMPAEKVGAMLNSYFTEVAEEIFRFKGTLVKFIGDAVFVIWGHPLKINNHAELACQAALAIQKTVEKFNSRRIYPALNTRIGIHTGPMVVGNLGSEKRFDYTAIGDAVNTASRIEGLNKYFGSRIIVSETVRKETDGKFNFLSIGSVLLAGKSDALNLNLLTSEPIGAEASKIWQEALSEFKNGAFDSAAGKFQSSAKADSALETAASVYLAEIDSLRGKEREVSWRGEVRFSGK